MNRERVNRRVVLRRAVQATAAAVAAGVLVQRDHQPVDASHSTAVVNADQVNAHYVYAASEDGSAGLYGLTTSDTFPGIYGSNQGLGPGIQGISGGNGVEGLSYNPGASAVYGQNSNGGYGVAGDTTSSAVTTADLAAARAGVFGRNNGSGPGVLGLSVNSNGDGVWGSGKVGIHGTSTTSGGYGALIEGGKAQLRIVPKSTTGKPATGTHSKGELFLDAAATLWICTVAGTPGTWRKVSTTAS